MDKFADFYAQLSNDEKKLSEEDYKRLLAARTGTQLDNTSKDKQYYPQGFSSIDQYYKSGYIEVLWFYGTVFDEATLEFHKNKLIGVVDGVHVLFIKEAPKDIIFHSGWTPRPDNLWCQGPLDNVVGINYMINHRENGKNEAIDKFIYPDRAYVGDVEEIYDPVTGHTKYIMPEGGGVNDITPDSTVLTFDNQIMMHRQFARESARLPQQLAGFRTAGEKTALEVQSLNDGAFRGFIKKAERFEMMLNKIVSAELRVTKENFTSVINILEEDEEGIMLTTSVTEKDLSANGKLIPVGSSRFSKQLQQISGLNQVANSQIGAMIMPHINTYQLARVVEKLFQFENYEFVNKFASIDEQLEMQQKQMLAQQQTVADASQPTSLEMDMQAQAGGFDEGI